MTGLFLFQQVSNRFFSILHNQQQIVPLSPVNPGGVPMSAGVIVRAASQQSMRDFR